MALAVLCLAACTPVTLQEHVKGVGRDDHMGTLDARLRALPQPPWQRSNRNPRNPAIAYGAQSNNHFVIWRGYDGREMCGYADMSWLIPMDSTYAGEVAKFEKVVQQGVVLFGAYDSLEAIPHDWPARPASSRNSLTKKVKRSDKYQDGEGDWHTYSLIDFEMEYCGPAPAVSSSTRVITMMAFAPKQEDNRLYAWRVEGAPTAQDAGSAPADDPVTAPSQTPTAPVGTTSSSVVSKRAIPGAMKDQSGYLGFLTIVDCAKKYNELSGGKLSVLAFSDPTIMKVIPDQKARSALKDRSTCSAIYSAHVATQVSLEGGVLSAVTLDGQKREAKLDPSLPIIEAKNGTIYPVQEIWKP